MSEQEARGEAEAARAALGLQQERVSWGCSSRSGPPEGPSVSERGGRGQPGPYQAISTPLSHLPTFFLPISIPHLCVQVAALRTQLENLGASRQSRASGFGGNRCEFHTPCSGKWAGYAQPTQVTTFKFSFASEATSTPSHLPHSPPLPLFRIPALLDLIAREGGWSAPPVGPIGMQLNVKDAKWVLVV